MRQPIVMGNWKLNGNKQMVSDLISALKTELDGTSGVTVAVAPPVLYLEQAEKLLQGHLIQLGSQNVDIHANGAFTGDISPVMLKEIGAQYIIIGHSERRQYHHESDEYIAQKFAFLKENGLIPVFCIGESDEENKAGKTEAVLFRQLDAVLKTQGAAALNGAVIAYEPIWAIGTGRAATSEQAQAIHKAIRNHIASYDKDVASNLVIQYGGSVKASNAAELFAMEDIDGALVGGAALDAKEFAAIVKAAAKAKA